MQSAYMIVKRFEVLYRQFAGFPAFDMDIYALPRFGTGPEHVSVRYHGLDREPLVSDRSGGGLLAEMRMAELAGEDRQRCDGPFLFLAGDVAEVLQWADEELPGQYEPVWARMAGTWDNPPQMYKRIGYEPSYFPGGHFSALCDCLCFPRWHGTDREGTLFGDYFRQLNAFGLFDWSAMAEDFLTYYLSLDWTETGDYEIAEIWILDQ